MKHPAVYTDSFLPIFAKLLEGSKKVLDPFAGTGKLAKIKNFGFTGLVVCNELESEWTKTSPYPVDEWRIGDARDLSWCVDIDAVCTSPTYGNRMADSHNAKDSSRRITYTHYLGRKLTDGNSGKMQWGENYKKLHEDVWSECLKTLPVGGKLIINISNHIRNGKEIDVVGWHEECVKKIGFDLVQRIEVETPRMRFGQNSQKRIQHEVILFFTKLKEKNT
jgi:tRNA G10  N-methylase Trm11